MRLATHRCSVAGERGANEDAVGIESGPEFALLLLADGLGAHGGGAGAATRCVAAATAAFQRAPGLTDCALQRVVDAADVAVTALRAAARAHRDSMRTTLALLAVCGVEARWLHVGDSRVYWFRGGALMARTRDHSVAQLVADHPDASTIARTDTRDRHRLLRAIGGGEGSRAEFSDPITLGEGDAFLLCSDGVWSLLDDREIAACLAASATAADWGDALQRRFRERLAEVPPAERDDCSIIAAIVQTSASARQ